MNQAVGNGEQGREPSAAPQPDVEPQKMSLPPANNPTVPKVSREKRILKFVKDWGGVATVLIAILYTFPFDAAGRFIHWREQSLLDARKVLSEVAALYGAGTVAAANIQDAQARSFLLGTYNIRIYNALLQDRAVIKAAENKLLPSELYMIGSLYSLMGLSDGIPYYKLAISKSKNDDEKVTIYREMGDALFRPGSYQDIAEARVDYDQALSIASKIPYQQMTYIQYAAELGQLELLYGDWKCGQTVTSY
jgi:tetratricopeptide (TPR) repeat protein